MNAQKLYNFILNLRKKESRYEKDTVRLFNFLYDGVRSYFTDIIDTDDYDEIFDNALEEIDEIIDGDDSIFECYEKMLNDNNTMFIDKFFNNVNSALDFFDSKLYRDNDFKPFTYIFNIYIMLKLYEFYKNDFDKYSALVDDFSMFIGFGELDKNYSDNRAFTLYIEKLDFISEMLSSDCVLDFPEAKKMLMGFVGNICSTHYYGDLDELDDNGNELLSLLSEIKRIREYPNFNEEVLKEFFKELFNEEELHYAPILMLGDRNQYFDEKYDVIDNSAIYREIFQRISELNIDLFEELKGDEDSFIEIMDIIFDSDSFYEMESKLDDLEEVSNIYSAQGLTKECLDIIKNLNSNKHNKKIEGIVIKYPESVTTINKINKPERISDRTYDICKLASRDIFKYSTDEFEDILIYSETMSEYDDRFCTYVYDSLEEKKKQESKAAAFIPVVQAGETNPLENKEEVGIQKIKSIFGRKK